MSKHNLTSDNKASKVQKTFTGEVVSDKMDKTIVVKVSRTFKHPLLGKVLVRSKKYKVHDEHQVAKEGNIVEFVQTRPLSKTKYMTLTKVVRS